MKKTTAIILVGMCVVVGWGSVVMADDVDPIGSNRPPNAPVFIEATSDWEAEEYNYLFYAEDPDGDQVYYEITWRNIDEPTRVSCSPDDPVVPWIGPFESGETMGQTYSFEVSGEYELRIRAKDIHGSIGPFAAMTVTYQASTVLTDDDVVGSNRPPNAPVFIEEKSDWEKESYTYAFSAEDPDDDQVYYQVIWKKVSDSTIMSCSCDDPVVSWIGPFELEEDDDPMTPWFGPFESGEELQKTHSFDTSGTYELTIQVKDTHGSIGLTTTITITYKSKMLQLPMFSQFIENYPALFSLLAKLF